MAEAAHSSDLRQAFQEHLKQTHRQLEDVERLAQQAGEKAGGHTCKGIKGIFAEGQEVIKKHKNSAHFLAHGALISVAQCVEHYEIAGYGTATA